MERKFDFVEVTLDGDYDMVKEVYRLHKEQAKKILSLVGIHDINQSNKLKDSLNWNKTLILKVE